MEYRRFRTQTCQPLGSEIRGSFSLASMVTFEIEFCQNLMWQHTVTTVDSEAGDSLGGHKSSLGQDSEEKFASHRVRVDLVFALLLLAW